MKKYFLIVALIATLFLTGCGSLSDKSIRNNFLKDTQNLKAYTMEGTLKLTNNDDTYEYDVKVNYKTGDKYKVSLTNKANNYEQIILKNEDVYVITPSLNKSFKFQSDWPNNNSQSYLLDSVAQDLKDDSKYSFTKKNDDYVFTTKTNYPNNPKYTKQDIILDKNYNLKKVEVKDDDNITYVEFEVTKLDKNAKLTDKDFDLEEITKDFKQEEPTKNQNDSEKSKTTETSSENQTENQETEEKTNSETSDTTETEETTSENNTQTSTTSKVDENIFPLYLPSNTSLSDKEVIETTDGERIIMTFSGDNPFILVEETASTSKELEIIPTYGEPFMLIDTVGSLTDTSYTWTSNGIEYYIVSEQMDQNELLEVAKSINIVSTISEK